MKIRVQLISVISQLVETLKVFLGGPWQQIDVIVRTRLLVAAETTDPLVDGPERQRRLRFRDADEVGIRPRLFER